VFNIFRSKNKNNDINTDEVTPQKNQIEQPELSSENNHNIDTVEATSDSNKRTPQKLKINQLKQVNDNDLLLYLKQQLGIDVKDEIEIIGELSATYSQNFDRYYHRIYNAKSKAGGQIEYPISDLDKRDTVKENGIYVPEISNKILKDYVNTGANVLVKCKLQLSSSFEREKHNNPLLLNVDPKSVQKLHEINKDDVIKDDNGNVLVGESVVNYYSTLKKEEIQKVVTEELETLENIKANLVKLGDEYNSKEKNIQNQELKLEKLQTEIGVNQETKVHLQDEVAHIKIELDHLKDIQMKEIEKFRMFIKDKVETLVSLEFISEKQRDILMGNYHTEINKEDIFIDFRNDLNESFSSAIAHIQMYLYKQGIIYPKYILEDYFSLIQTNDLIILAGESGSGKTNLVKSFAEAVGGVSKIIPVKPNWTSSEDLLGYYNPLEKKYLSTPFLDAILEASRNPEVPYFICLDEMNLARVEYYFADFLSKLEERKDEVEIFLYSDTESGHVLSEFNHVLDSIQSSKEKFKKENLVKYIDILKDEEVNNELKRIFGFSDKDSLIKYHSDLRKMISGILDIPSSITFPKNVRIIGAVNIDETTHYLSPKVLDRAHVMKFTSPLLYDREMIANERNSETDPKAKIKFSIEDFGERCPYPDFKWDDKFCTDMVDLTEKYFVDLGVDVGFRTIRQGLNYRAMLNSFQTRKDIFINNFILHKILPKFTFDGSSDVKGRKKIDILKDFKAEAREIIGNELQANDTRNAMVELEDIIRKSSENDGVVNYWA